MFALDGTPATLPAQTPARSPDLSPSTDRIESALEAVVAGATAPPCPPRLREAMHHAVFPGGARLRPRLCLAVAAACGDARPELADAAAAAVELIHCASLVHDDLPCFDDAELRRGAPSVHQRFGAATALLAGDALIVLAFETLARVGASAEALVLATATGSARGLIAGQAWESEEDAPLAEYHRAKTAALFEAAARLGAMASRAERAPLEGWCVFGEAVGRAYQAADDLADVISSPAALGKSTGKDAALGRPSMVRAYGIDGARRRARDLLSTARAAIPRSADEAPLEAWLDRLAKRLGA
jgi:geranylgeranyl diphosphate synthase type II